MIKRDMLIGQKEIAAFVGRDFKTIKVWVKQMNFPAMVVDRVWMADTELIRQWLRTQIQKQCQ